MQYVVQMEEVDISDGSIVNQARYRECSWMVPG